MLKTLSCPGTAVNTGDASLPAVVTKPAFGAHHKVCGATQQRFSELRIGSHTPSLTTKAQTKLQKPLKAAIVFLLPNMA